MEKLRMLGIVVGTCALLNWGAVAVVTGCDECGDPCSGDPVFVQRDKRDLAGLALARSERQKNLPTKTELTTTSEAGKSTAKPQADRQGAEATAEKK